MRKSETENVIVRTDDLVLSASFDGRIILWALGPNAKLLPLSSLQRQDHLPAVSQVFNLPMGTLLRQSDFLLNNVDVNPIEIHTEILVTLRSKDAYLVKLAVSGEQSEPKVVQSFDSIDEVRYGRFSNCGKYVYTLTKTGTLNIFNKMTAKLISKLNNQGSDSAAEVEIDGILSTRSEEIGEQLLAYRSNRVILFSE